MKAIGIREVAPASWDDVAENSGEAWAFHRWDWVEVEAKFAAKANCSFAILDNSGRLIGIHPLYRRDLDRGWVERVLDSGYHRHTGLALRDSLAVEVRQGAAKLAMQHVLMEAERFDVDRILLNRHNLAPAVLAHRGDEIPIWVRDFGFELGMHMTPVGDLAVPGISNVFADQILSLEPPEDELFRKVDKAAVRKAERSGLTFAPAEGNAVAEYYDLAKVSAQRTREALPGESYYQMIWDRLGKAGRAAILFARHQGKAVAANYYVMDKGAVSYLAGVSHAEYLSCGVNDFLHWHAIRWAKGLRLGNYRFGPVFPEIPTHWPVAKVSWFKSKFGSQSYATIQGNYFRKPERYRDDTLRAAENACKMRIQQVQARRQAETVRNIDPARDLVMVLRRYGFLNIEPRARASDLVEKHGLWWTGCPASLSESVDKLQAIVHPQGDALASLCVGCHPEAGSQFLHEIGTWWAKKRRVYRALLPHCSFSGPGIQPIWQNEQGRAVLAWWHCKGRKILLVGLAVAEELIRYTQGDPNQTRTVHDRTRFNFTFERANYLFDTNLVPEAAGVPWADRLGYALVRLLARQSGLPLVDPLPDGVKGLVLLTGDDDQAALAAYQKQLSLVGDFPITYFLLPHTKHTFQTLAALPAAVEFGLHVDALDHPDQYETICAEQAAAVRKLCGQPARAVRNHGYLNRGYLGHLRAWEECGLTLDVNYAGLDGTALTGSFLPFRVRRPDGTWSGHLSLLTAFGDGMRYIGKLTEQQAIQRIDKLAGQIERSDPGVLVFNMHPENIGDTRLIHRRIMELGRRPGWRAMGVESYINWLEKWQSLTVRAEDRRILLDAAQPVEGVVLRQLSAGQQHRVEATGPRSQPVIRSRQAS